MKLLFDQNISFRILREINTAFPNSNQVKSLGLSNASDTDILKYAKQYDYSIVTFDSDFRDLSLIYGHPPKIILLRIGNNTTKHIAEILLEKEVKIKDFLSNEVYNEIALLEIL